MDFNLLVKNFVRTARAARKVSRDARAQIRTMDEFETAAEQTIFSELAEMLLLCRRLIVSLDSGRVQTIEAEFLQLGHVTLKSQGDLKKITNHLSQLLAQLEGREVKIFSSSYSTKKNAAIKARFLSNALLADEYLETDFYISEVTRCNEFIRRL